MPFWSPDGQFIAFFAANKLKRVAVSGGGVQTVCEVFKGSAAGGAAEGGAWGQDGAIIYAVTNSPLMRVLAMGGMAQPVTALTKGERLHAFPQFLPGGRHVLYLAMSEDPANRTIYVQELGSAKRVRVLQNLTRAMWSPPPAPRRLDQEGYLLFVREGTLFAQRMDAKTFKMEGEALAVAQEVRANDGNGVSSFAVSGNGVLAYRSGALLRTTQLTWRGRDGSVLGTVGAPGRIISPALSPDGKSVVVLVGDLELEMDAWVMDLATGVFTRMTRDAKASIYDAPPAWSPDSQRLAITRSHGGPEEITLASGEVISLTKEPVSAWGWSPDGRSILCAVQTIAARRILLLSLADGAKLQTILDTPYGKSEFRFSPDGQYLVYVSAESGTKEIYVASFPSFAVKRKVSSGGGNFPVWAKGGKEIFYRSNDGSMMQAEVQTGANIEASIPKPLFQFGSGVDVLNRFAVTADGQRFLTSEPVQNDEAEKPEITLVLNWAAEMKQQ